MAQVQRNRDYSGVQATQENLHEGQAGWQDEYGAVTRLAELSNVRRGTPGTVRELAESSDDHGLSLFHEVKSGIPATVSGVALEEINQSGLHGSGVLQVLG